MKHCLLCAFTIFLFSIGTGYADHGTNEVTPSVVSEQLYERIFDLGQGPSPEVFRQAVNGWLQLEKEGKLNANKRYITIIDFTKPSTEERLWVVDVQHETVLFHCLVAHGKNTGDNWAQHFSNIPESLQSSLGFYVTGKTYTGKHGLSLYLDGMESGINDKARERSIVIHGANYVSREFIQRTGRLGRSFGCPAVSMDIHETLINTIADGTCLFIWYPDVKYLSASPYLGGTLTATDRNDTPVY